MQISNSLFAQNAYKYSNEFLSIGTGARAFAMGNCSVASVNDATATYWNTASLTNLTQRVNLNIMHASFYMSLAQYNFGTVAFKPNDKSAFAVSLIRFGVDNIPNTTQLIDQNGQLRFDRISAFSVADYSMFLSYAHTLDIEGLSVGGNVKIIKRVAGDFAKAWGFGIDLSALYKMNEWQFGVMLRDVTSTFNMWTFNTTNLKEVFELTNNTIPISSTELTLPKIILGAAYKYNFLQKMNILAEVNLDISTDGKRNVLISGNPFSIDPKLGVELSYNSMFFVRTGIGNIQKEPVGFNHKMEYIIQPNIGLGIKYKQLGLDYALTNLGKVSMLGYSHIISLSYAFNTVKR